MEKIKFVARILAAGPVLFIGIQHLLGLAPMQPMLEGAGMPLPELTAVVAPIFEVIGALLLLLGFQARFGALLTLGAMAGAIATHLLFDHAKFEWADEPPIGMPIVIMLLSAIILVAGPGAWSLQSKKD